MSTIVIDRAHPVTRCAAGAIAGHPVRRLALADGMSTRLVDTGGSGIPLLLVHGLAASVEIWTEVLGPLADGRRVIAFDLPGFGLASKPDVDYRYPFFADQLAAVLAALGIERVDALGSSMGASLLVRFDARHPGHLRRVVMANPAGFGPYAHPFLRVPTLPLLGPLLSRPQRPVNAFGVRLALSDRKLATREIVDRADEFSRLPGAHRAFVRTLRNVAGPSGVKDRDTFERQWQEMAAKPLVVWGRQDRLFPVEQALRARELRPEVRIVELDRCGHYPQLERPTALVALVADHLG